jgi:hypothetical protein
MAARNKGRYTDLENLKRRLSQRVERLKADLIDAEHELQAADLTLDLLKRGRYVDAESAEETDSTYLKEFEGLTQVQGLEKLAKDSGKNRFKLKEAVKTLTAAGLIKSQKNGRTILFTAIQRSGRFKRVAPGEYEPLPPPPRLKLSFKPLLEIDNAKKVSIAK